MTKTATRNITATINGVTFDNLTLEQAQVLAGMAMVTAETPKPEPKPTAKSDKPAKKTQEIRSKHDAILDSKRVERMAKTAIAKFSADNIEVKASKQGKWMWIYPCGEDSGKGRAPEFKAVKLAKGWKYSPKRGAFYRDFS